MNPPRQQSRERAAARIKIWVIATIVIVGCLITGINVTKVCGCGTWAQHAQIFVTTTLKTSLARYKIDNEDYPNTMQGLQALLTPPRGMEKTWDGPYLDLTPPDKMTLDPWDHAYRYAYPSVHASTASKSAGASGLTTTRPQYDIWSLGPDGKDGTTDDIGNW